MTIRSRSTAPRAALFAAALLPLSGCCTMARLFCGPDRSAWVPIAHDSARATLATFLEAVRRDDPDRVYGCLARSYLQAHGLDLLVANAFWDRLRQEVPGFHLLGYAEVPPRPLREQDGGVTYAIEVEGRMLQVDLVRQTYEEVRYRGSDGQPRRTSRLLDFDTLNGRILTTPAGFDPRDDVPLAKVEVAALTIEHPYVERLRLEDLDGVTIAREWKIANLVLPQ